MKKKLLIPLTILITLALAIGAFCYDEALILGRTPEAYGKIWVTPATVKQLSSIYRNTAGAVFITVELNNIRYRIDGGNPDANDGHPVVAGQNIWLTDARSILNFRMIAVGGGARVIVTYYRRI